MLMHFEAEQRFTKEIWNYSPFKMRLWSALYTLHNL